MSLRMDKITENRRPACHLLLSHHPIQILAMAVLTSLIAAGCIGRKEALLTTQKLRLTSETAINMVDLAKTNETMLVEAHGQVRQAYQKQGEQIWTSLIEQEKHRLDAAYHKGVGSLELQRAEVLSLYLQQRQEANKALDLALGESFREASQLEAAAETESLEARRRSMESPGDLLLVQKSLESDVKYFALAAKARDIQIRVRLRVQEELARSDLSFQERLQTATKAQREALLKTYTEAKDELASSEMPPVDLGPDPTVNMAFYESVIAYLEAVQQASRALEEYLEANWFGKRSLLQDFLRSSGKGFISGVIKPAASVKDAFANLKQAAKGLGQEYLTEIKEAASAARETLAEEGRTIAKDSSEALLRRVSSMTTDATNNSNQ